MSSVLQNGINLEIQQCGEFNRDDVFSSIVAKMNISALHGVPRATSSIFDTSALRLSTDVDGVFFSHDKFELVIDLRGFRPENIRCTVTPNIIEVSALQNERDCDGTRNFEKSMSMSRKYQLPSNIVPQNSICSLSSEGILYIMAPWNK